MENACTSQRLNVALRCDRVLTLTLETLTSGDGLGAAGIPESKPRAPSTDGPLIQDACVPATSDRRGRNK